MQLLPRQVSLGWECSQHSGSFKTKTMENIQNKLVFNKWLYRRLPYFLRRRLTPHQSPFVVVVLLASVVLILQSLSIIFGSNDYEYEAFKAAQEFRQIKSSRRRPLSNIVGIDPKLAGQYVPNQDNMFKCLESSDLIPFEWINDDYCDCPQDGSDEPATGACPNSKFYCTHTSR